MPSERNVFVNLISTGIAFLFGDKATRKPHKPPKGAATAADERTIHRVRQKYRTSCGVAAAAMLARKSHDEALPIIFPPKKGKRRRVFGTHYADVIKALNYFGVEHAARPTRVKAFDDIPTTSLVKAKWCDAGGKVGLHWVILQRKSPTKWYVIDPDPALGATQRLTPSECSQYTPVSYLPVTPVPPGRPRRT